MLDAGRSRIDQLEHLASQFTFYAAQRFVAAKWSLPSSYTIDIVSMIIKWFGSSANH
jgi:hypothetical protein